ncbi:MAG: phosphomannomutase/phosphoglucomutase, partial [Gammaproteobacteria bacterium]|nr:phosphomannomutase/phosphoglucomutase [Gammaproteobacteria bacterium]
IFVGRDGRLSSPMLCEALVEGLLSTGINVTNIGVVPTPMLWFACHTERGSQSGVMVTGSHNPAHYNGLKIMIAGNTLSGESVLALRNRLIRSAIEKGAGEESTECVKEDYINHIAEDVILATPMTVVLDCGNGAASEVAPELFNELGCNTIPLFAEIDGNFPNHHPDPSREENLEDLKAAVKENNADIGIAFDGDGDRIGIVTPSGKVIWPDRLMMLYAKDLLVRSPGADIIFDVKCSRRLPELISNLGGRPLMWKTGHSMIKGKLQEMNAALAGEMSGHIFFNDRWFGFDDALYCGARLLEILSTESEDVEHVFASLPESLATPEIFIPVPEDRKFQIIQSLNEVGQFGSGKINTIDGIRVDYPKAWGLIRASNTTPALTARFEAHNEEALVQIHSLFQKQLKQVDENLVIEDLQLTASPDA